MAHYCEIDLHSTKHAFILFVDNNEEDECMFEKRLDNDFSLTLKAQWVTPLLKDMDVL